MAKDLKHKKRERVAMSNGKDDGNGADRVVGRTYADAVVEVVHLLGKLAPAVILMVVAIGAFYIAQSQYQEQLQTATTQLVSTYQAIGDVSTKHIENLKSSLEVHEQVTKSIEAEKDKLLKAKEELKAAIKQREIEEAKIVQANKDYEELNQKLAAAGADVRKLTTEISKLKKDNSILISRNKKLEEKIKELVDSIESGESNISTKGIIDSLSTKTSDEIADLLMDYRFNYGKYDPKKFIRKMVSVEASIVDKAINKIKDNFNFIGKVISNEDDYGYYVIAEEDVDKYNGMLLIEIDDGKVSDVKVGNNLFLGRSFSPTDLSEKLYGLMFLSDNDYETELIDIKNYTKDKWNISEIFTYLFKENETDFFVIKSNDKRLEILSISQLSNKIKELGVKLEETEEVSRLISMSKLKDNFDARNLLDAGFDKIPVEPRNSLMLLLNASVQLNYKEARKYLDEGLGDALIGKIGAMVLAPDFQVFLPLLLNQNYQMMQEIGYDKRMDELLLVAEVGSQRRFSPPDRYELKLVKNNNGQWILETFQKQSVISNPKQ